MNEEDEPRFQGSDSDEFTAVGGIVYDQTAGEEMAARIIELELKMKYLESHHQITEATLGLIDVLIRDGEYSQAMEVVKEGISQIDLASKLYQPATQRMLDATP